MEVIKTLPSRILRVGDCVRVGRNNACEVMIQCPNISGLHCEIEVVTTAEEDDVEQNREDLEPLCFVRDHSSNGTWIQRGGKDATTESVAKHPKVVKLSKGSRERLRPGDLILLLAPMHAACRQYQLALEKGTNEGEYVIKQLPWKAKTNKDTSKAETKACSSTTAPEVKMGPCISSTSTVGSSTSSKLLESKNSDGDSPPGVKRKVEAAGRDNTDNTEDVHRYEVTRAIAPNVTTSSTVKMTPSVPSTSTSNSSKLPKRKKSDSDSPLGAKRKVKAPGSDSDIEADSIEEVKRMKKDEVTMATVSSYTAALIVKTTPSVSSSECKNSDNRSPHGPKRKGESAGSDIDADSAEKMKRMKTDEVAEMVCDRAKEIVAKESSHFSNESDSLSSTTCMSPTLSKDISQECCPICSRLFPVTELTAHSELCQSLLGTNPKDEASKPGAVTLSPPFIREADKCMEYCPSCMKLFPLEELIAHSESCTTSITPSTTSDSASIVTAVPSKPAVVKDASMEQCPNCLKLFPVAVLIVHSEECVKTMGSSVVIGSDGMSYGGEALDSAVETDGGGRRYDLEPHSPVRPREAGSAVVAEANAAEGRGMARGRGGSELEQCMYCLKDFTVLELVGHVSMCPMKDVPKCTVEEHCQHCLQLFPLDELVSHALSCPHRKDLGALASEIEEEGVVGSQDVWGEPVERCMHCFKDFPLSALVEHSRRCTGDMLGSRDRFKGFLPSIHDLDPMALAVLNDTQNAAVEYVIKKSKAASEKVHSGLLKRVCRLGYTEDDMERTLQWVRREAPIIIHLSLDRVLHFLVEDTHYRNQFETRTSGGSTCLSARTSWEDRIFNKIYAHSPPVDRVKYGVLNIVGDPRGVRSCYGYGDSFLQLKKVRLRTTFASADTSMGTVKLSCCEYYGNVLHEYSDNELRAILDVSTRKKSFLRSDVISTYKEIQIHGPVCLSENVECIVVNDRHAKDPHIGSMLEKFVERNKCNLIWMEPEADMRYPDFSADTSRPATGVAPMTVPPSYPTLRRGRRYDHWGSSSSRRRREYHYEAYYDDEYSDSDECSDSEEECYDYYGY